MTRSPQHDQHPAPISGIVRPPRTPLPVLLAEASLITGRTTHMIRHCIGFNTTEPTFARRNNRRVQVFGRVELRFLILSGDLVGDLTRVAQRRLFVALADLPEHADEVRLGKLSVDLTDANQRISDGLTRIAEVRSAVDATGTSPVLRAGGWSVQMLAELADADALTRLRRNHPDLTEDHVALAIDYMRLHPVPKETRAMPIPGSFKDAKSLVDGLPAYIASAVEHDEGLPN